VKVNITLSANQQSVSTTISSHVAFYHPVINYGILGL